MDSALALRNSISHLAFPPTPSSTPLRQSTRNSACGVKTENKEEPLSPSRARPPTKRRLIKQDSDEESPKKKKARTLKRGYADPETYAHLNALSDYLAPHLDGDESQLNSSLHESLTYLWVVIFCGIK
jgi:hypothetical protein